MDQFIPAKTFNTQMGLNSQSMAGWSKLVADGSSLDFLKTLQELQVNSNGSVNCGENEKLRCLFNQLISGFLKQICGSHCFRPLPPMLGEGQSVDLLKLYLSVREKGGYESVCKNGLWDLVAEKSGFDSSVSSGLKLVYVKYLDLLEKWFRKVKNKDSESGFSYMDLETELKGVFLEISGEKKRDEYMHMVAENVELDFNGVQKMCKSNEAESCAESDGGKESASEKDGTIFESSVVVEDDSSRKRKRERYLAMLNWVQKVAKDPCDPAIGSLPERYKWKSYGSEHVWKQVLLAREAMILKPNVDSSAEQSIWQKKQKMHPTIYDDQNERSTSRCSQRLISAKESPAVLSSRRSQARDCSQSSSTGTQRDLEDESDSLAADSIWGNNHRRKRIPIGPYFQAKVSEWTGETYESEVRWLGIQVWPPEKGEQNKNLIERDRIGKGRQDSCGCQFPGSLECVKYHVAEKRKRVKLELGSAFFKWKFDNMGEEVSLSWTREEEKKFQFIVKSNPASMEKCFWDEISKFFRRKSREVLASYYFNVYLLRRRGDQNRLNPSNIDSDDDELENIGLEVTKSSGSILCSPKKVHLNFR